MDGPTGSQLSRRRLLTAVLLAPAATAACAFPAPGPEPPDPLIALAESARADVTLVAAALAAVPELVERLGPLRDARAEHAAALDAEIARLDPGYPVAGTAAPSAGPATPAAPPDGPAAALSRLRETLTASGDAAAIAVLDLPVHRVGLVASVAACCAVYAGVLV